MKKLFAILLMTLSISILTGCTNPIIEETPVIEQVKADLIIDDELGEVTLPTLVDGVIITWQSSKPNLITSNGEIIKPAIDIETSLTATLTYEDRTMTKIFTVLIYGDVSQEYSVDYNKIQDAIDSISFDDFELIEDINLILLIDGIDVVWTSNDETYISTSGVVTRPVANAGDAEVTLTATLTYNEIILEKDFIFTVIDLTQTVVYIGYYSGASDLIGEALKLFLHELIDDHTVLSYTTLWTALALSDEDPNNPNNVILLYTGRSQLKTEIQSGNNNQDYWNREHVWPKAHGSFDTNDTEGTDMHHIRPTDVSVNAERGSLDFDYGGSTVFDGSTATLNLKDGDSFEPRDAVKGDVARMIFYMAVRYEGENGELDFELNDSTNTQGTPFMGNLQILLEWHLNDPVDAFEMNRNDVIFSYQGNRNPFIDHPEFAELIWGTN